MSDRCPAANGYDRSSRWGRPRHPDPSASLPPPPATHNPSSSSSRNHDHDAYATAAAPVPSSLVSDHDALQALMRSAEKEVSERPQRAHHLTSHNQQPRGDRRREGQHHHHNLGRGDNNDPTSGGRRRCQRQEGHDDGVGYYGPPSRRQGNDGNDYQADGRQHAARIVNEEDREERRKRRKGTEEEEVHDDHHKDNRDSDETNKIKPDFGLSGALSKDAKTGNVYKGVLLKFREPPEARAPNTRWRLYVYKSNELVDTLHVHKQSAYLVGRHQDVCDIMLAHPSCSSQHAVLQYRAVPHKPTGQLQCLPYIMDLESTNGTFLNRIKIDPARYYQLKAGDVLTFGASTREYVLIAA